MSLPVRKSFIWDLGPCWVYGLWQESRPHSVSWPIEGHVWVTNKRNKQKQKQKLIWLAILHAGRHPLLSGKFSACAGEDAWILPLDPGLCLVILHCWLGVHRVNRNQEPVFWILPVYSRDQCIAKIIRHLGSGIDSLGQLLLKVGFCWLRLC